MLQKMKILQLGKAYPPVNLGGVEVVIQLLAEGLNSRQIMSDALGVNDKYEFQVEEGKHGGKIFRVKLILKAFSTLLSIQLITFLNRIKNDYSIIHIHSPDPMAALALFICRPSCKVVLHWHSDILKQKLLLFFYKPILLWLLRRADLVLATSPTYIDGSSYLTKFRSKTKVLPIGIDIEVPAETIDVARFAQLFSAKKVTFSLGRLAYYKGYEYLVKAASFLPDDHLVVIAGEGNERTKLEAVIEQYKLSEKVILLGKVTEAEKYWLFKNCDVFALSSVLKTEAYAIVQVEALALGKPVVSTRIPGSGVDWVNQHNQTGITVPIKDAYALSEGIAKILGDRKLYERYSAEAHVRYHSHFTDEIMINDLINYYNLL
jgi:rhamnosyl/mannosyltransferase